jgi:hypothetical protein
MSLTPHALAVSTFTRGLGALDHLLDKAAASGLDEAVLFDARLAPDMRPFPDQIRMAAFGARGCVARLAGCDWPKTDDGEATLADLKATVAMSRDFVNSLAPAAFEGADKRRIELRFPGVELNFEGEGYLTGFAVPNFYFHVTMAYAILRNQGVELGKKDFLGQLPLI